MEHVAVADDAAEQQFFFHVARVFEQGCGQAGGGVLAFERDEGGVEEHHALVVDEFELRPGPEEVVVGAAGHAEFEDGAVAERAQAG